MIKDKSVEIRGILREQQKQRRTAVCLSVGNKDVLKVVVLYGFNGCLFNLFIHQEEKLFASFFLLLSLCLSVYVILADSATGSLQSDKGVTERAAGGTVLRSLLAWGRFVSELAGWGCSNGNAAEYTFCLCTKRKSFGIVARTGTTMMMR